MYHLYLGVTKIYIDLTSQSEIIEIAMDFDSNKAPRYDNILMAVVRHSIGIILRPLTHIINLCISHGHRIVNKQKGHSSRNL